MNTEQAEDYTQSLGQIVGGAWRQISWAKQIGVPKALGLSVEDWVNDRLGGYVKMAVDDRRNAIAELIEDGETQRGAAEILGVDPATVSRDLQPVADATVDTQEMAENSQPETESIANATPVDGLAALAISEMPDADKPTHVSNNSGENEWYTPPALIAAVRGAMGGVDLDPASSATANEVVGAEKYYTIEDDGLSQKWFGRVFLNPPYAQPFMAEFADAVAEKYAGGEIEEACVLVNNATETAWFQRMANTSNAVCLISGRVKFLNEKLEVAKTPLQGQVVLYFGKNRGSFIDSFSKIGLIFVS